MACQPLSVSRRSKRSTDGCERVGTWDRRSTMLISADSNRTSRSDRSLPPTRSAHSESHNVDEDLSGMTIPFRPVPPVASWAASHKEAKMVRHPKTLIDFMEMYPTEEDCRQALFEHRWPQGFSCRRCGQRCSKSAWRQSSSVGYISMKSISVFGCRTIFASLWVAAQEATGGT